jgi:protein-S-isoprenylcysteine O-methyltransferase Ste14
MAEMLASNSPSAIQQRIQAGRIGWASPLVLTAARTGLILLVQALVATAFLIRGVPSPWRAQAPWWTVYATLVDVGCLLLLSLEARREGLRLVDLFGIERVRLGREALWGLLYLVVLFPIFVGGGTKLAGWLIYGTTQLKPAMLAPGLLSDRQLPTGRRSTACRSFG